MDQTLGCVALLTEQLISIHSFPIPLDSKRFFQLDPTAAMGHVIFVRIDGD